MGIREKLTEKPVFSICIAIAVVIGAVVYTVRSVMPSDAYTKAYFTTDDGQSLFTESMDKLAPFDHHGSPACRAYVFSCDDGKTTFVGYLERCIPKGLDRLKPLQADFQAGKSRVAPSPNPDELEVKKPGPSNPWVNRANYQEAQKITNVQCPDGSGGTPEVQFP